MGFQEEKKDTLDSLEYEVQNETIQDIHQYLMSCKYRSWELAVFVYRELINPIHGVFKIIQENNSDKLFEVYVDYYDLQYTTNELSKSKEVFSSIKKIKEKHL